MADHVAKGMGKGIKGGVKGGIKGFKLANKGLRAV